MSLIVRKYEAADSVRWDALCRDSLQGTFLHTRAFLSYHKDKFEDVSLVLEKDNKLVGVLPAARDPVDSLCVSSHPGITYGGIVHAGALSGSGALDALQAAGEFYARAGFSKLLYKVVPHIYHRVPAQDDLYALFRSKGVRVRCDVTNCIDLTRRPPKSSRRVRCLKKARLANIEISRAKHHVPELWAVISENLKRKHGVSPVHSVSELVHLVEAFDNEIFPICALLDGRVVAGILMFAMPTCWHAQYIASNERGYEVSALDLLFDSCIGWAAESGKQWFDFGISTEQGGKVLNQGLYTFKAEFGAGALVHEFYELNL